MTFTAKLSYKQEGVGKALQDENNRNNYPGPSGHYVN